MHSYVVTTGRVTAVTNVGAGRAYRDFRPGDTLPADVPVRDVADLLRRGLIEEVPDPAAVPPRRVSRRRRPLEEPPAAAGPEPVDGQDRGDEPDAGVAPGATPATVAGPEPAPEPAPDLQLAEPQTAAEHLIPAAGPDHGEAEIRPEPASEPVPVEVPEPITEQESPTGDAPATPIEADLPEPVDEPGDVALVMQVPTGTVAQVVAWVDGDLTRAAAALTAEQAAEKPRQTLVRQLAELAEQERTD